MKQSLIYFICLIAMFSISSNLYATDAKIMPESELELPTIKQIKNAKECKLYNKDALNCIKWLTNTPIEKDRDKREDAQKFLFMWIETSDEVSIIVGEQYNGFLALEALPIFMVYAGECSKIQLNNKSKNFTFEVHYNAMLAALRFYEKNKAHITPNETLDKYLELEKNGLLNNFLESKFQEEPQ